MTHSIEKRWSYVGLACLDVFLDLLYTFPDGWSLLLAAISKELVQGCMAVNEGDKESTNIRRQIPIFFLPLLIETILFFLNRISKYLLTSQARLMIFSWYPAGYRILGLFGIILVYLRGLYLLNWVFFRLDGWLVWWRGRICWDRTIMDILRPLVAS